MASPSHLRTTAEPFPHLPALDGLRGVAVALVVGYHLFARQLPGGFLGVDVFFVLSGFLITSLLVAEVRDVGRLRLGRFYVRRARRLLPALFLVLLGLAAYAAIWGAPEELTRLRTHSLWTLGYLANWRFVADGTTYTDLVVGQSPLRHTWSLAIEEQFYVLFPLVVVLVLGAVRGDPGRLRRALVGVGVVGAVLSAGWMALVFDVADPSRGYFGTDTRAHALLVGVALGAVLVGRPPVTGRAATAGRVTATVGVGVLAVAVARSHETSAGLQRGGFLVVALAVAGIILGLEALVPLRAVLTVRPLVRLGVISYGVYLWHWPVVVILDGARTGLDGAPLALLRLLVTLALAVASYTFVERPIRRGSLGRSFGPVAVGFAPAAMVLLAGVVVATTIVPRVRTRDDGVTAAAFTTTTEGADGPSSTVVPLPRRVVLEGDSVAHTLAGGTVGEFPHFEPWRPAHSPFDPAVVDLQSAAKPACSFLPGAVLGPMGQPADLQSFCTGWQQQLGASLVGTSGGAVVVALANDASDRLVDGERVALGSDEHEALLAGWLDEVRTIADEHGADLVLVALPPRTGRAASSADGDGAREVAMREELRAYANGHDAVRLLDLFEQVCPDSDCERPTPGFDPAWRYDGMHFTRAGAAWVAAWLTEALVYD